MRNRIYDKLIHRFYDLPLSRKFILSFTVFTIIPFVLLFAVFYSDISEAELDRAEKSAMQAFDQAVSYMEFKVKNVNDIINMVAVDARLNDIFIRNLTGYDQGWQEEKKDYDYLRQLISRVRLQSDRGNIAFYFSNPASYTDLGIDLLSMESARDKEWFSLSSRNNGRIMWFPSEYFNYERELPERKRLNPSSSKTGSVVTIKAVKNSNDLKHVIGFLRYDIPEKEMRDILVNAATVQAQSLYVVNEKNTIVYSNRLESGALPAVLVKLAGSVGKTNGRGWQKAKLETGEVLIGTCLIEGTDWQAISVLPYSDLQLTATRLKSRVLLFFVLLVISVYMIAVIISNTNTRRLKRFVALMKSAGKGDFAIEALPRNNDEIGVLAQNFNGMLTRISMLLDEQYRMGQEVKNAELKALQAQINPHFLYNTLDLIHWFAALGKTDELIEVVYSLSRFYKLTLSRGEDIIPLRDEIEHVKTYVDIQNVRFDGFVKLEVEVVEELLDYSIPKVTLQPLVENSILHGIMEKEDARGTVRITAGRSGEHIFISVADDGVGMGEEFIKMLESGEIKSKGCSYGIRNIKERIRLQYGEECRMNFKSSPGGGTEVSILIHAKELRMN